ncbi:MAG: TolC family protein [Porphyromonadaceae bacterium]|nr:TolC family protein [Porphyromonadaceae bacterium]
MNRSIIIYVFALAVLGTDLGLAQETSERPKPLGAKAAQTLTLEDCIRLAKMRNLELKGRELSIDRARVQLQSRRSEFLPSVGANAGQGFSFGRSQDKTGVYVDRSSASTSVSVSASLSLFSGFQRLHDLKAAQLDMAGATAELQKAREDLALQVTQLYYSWLFAREVSRSTAEQCKRTRQVRDYTKELVTSGRWSRDKLSEAEAQLATEELRHLEALNALELTKLDLMQAIESPNNVEIQEIDIDQESKGLEQAIASAEQIYETALEIRPELQMAKYAIGSAQHGIQSARSGYYPALSLSAGYSNSYYYQYGAFARFNPTFADQWEQNGRSYVSLNLNIPIFDAFRTRSRIRMAKINYTERTLQLEQTKKKLHKEIAQARANVLASQRKISASQASVVASSEALELIEAKLMAGKATMNEFSEAKTRHLLAEIEALKARYDFALRRRVLELYISPNE